MTEVTAKVELKPCPNPWCGRDTIVRVSALNDDATAHVGMFCMCVACDLQSPTAPTEAEAVTLWNQRDLRPDDALREADKHLRAIAGDRNFSNSFVGEAYRRMLDAETARAAVNERNPDQ